MIIIIIIIKYLIDMSRCPEEEPPVWRLKQKRKQTS